MLVIEILLLTVGVPRLAGWLGSILKVLIVHLGATVLVRGLVCSLDSVLGVARVLGQLFFRRCDMRGLQPMSKELRYGVCIVEELGLIYMLILAALDSLAVLARDAWPLGLEVIVDIDLRAGTKPVRARKEVLAKCQRLAADIVLLALQFLYDLGSNFISQLLYIPEVAIDIFEFLLDESVLHDLALHPLDDVVCRLWLSEAGRYVPSVSHFVALVGACAVTKALGSSQGLPQIDVAESVAREWLRLICEGSALRATWNSVGTPLRSFLHRIWLSAWRLHRVWRQARILARFLGP